MHAISNTQINRRQFNGILTGEFFSVSFVTAQNAQPGFFRLINATGIPGKVIFDINEEYLSEDGYESGESTGSIGLVPGPCQIVAKHPTWADATLPFELKSGERTAIVLYSTIVLDDEGREKKRILKFTQFSCKPEQRARVVTLLSVSTAAQLSITLADVPLTLEPKKPKVVNLSGKAGQTVGVLVAGVSGGSLDLEEAGAYGVIIFDNSDVKKGCVTFFEVDR